MGRAPNLTGRIFAVIAFSVALYAILATWTGWHELRGQLAGMDLAFVLPLVALSLGNYLFRYWRWEFYLRTLGVRIPRRDSMALFFGSFIMVITPGKLGEAFKAGILWEKHDVPLSSGLPVVLGERIFDFLGVLALTGLGLVFWSGPLTGLTAGLLLAAGMPLLLVMLRSRRVRRFLLRQALRAPWLRSHKHALENSFDSLGLLLSPRVAMPSFLISFVAWSFECISLWLVGAALSFPLGLFDAVFVYASATIVGSLTFLPGGLGGTEGTLIWLLLQLGTANDAAVTAALVVRIATLWVAVLIGFAVFLAFRRTFLGSRILTGDGNSTTRESD